ncbi:EAL domain-containing protein [Rahnella sp. Larv3_ips]|uniref:sensor domain-containing diguanylate cyclase n=1 Tax=Rahnella sp. Larv3_ips TaxID=1896943 RepID=UPI000EFAC10B|nr:EAL domain-containing protein [Rahnella sp. Larv3_ips]
MLTNLSNNEAKRHAAIDALKADDRGRDETLQKYTFLACRLLNVPMCFVSVLDDEKQFVKSAQNVPFTETSLSDAFCAHTIRSEQTLICNDTLQDETFMHYRLVHEAPYIRFYGGSPLRTREGVIVGTLCVLDSEAREFTHEQIETFEKIAELMSVFLETWHAVGYVDIVTLLPNRQRLLRDMSYLNGADSTLVIIDCLDIAFAYEVARSMGMGAVESLLQDMALQLKARLKLDGLLYAVAVGRYAFFLKDSDTPCLQTISEKLTGTQASLNNQIPLNLDIHIGDSGEFSPQLNPAEILRRAVSALHEAISQKKRFMTYDADIDDKKRNDFQLLAELRKALHERSGLYLVYQPKISLTTGEVTGAEALIRWKHPLLGEIMPGQFIPLVQKTSLMSELTDWVIEHAIRQLSLWGDKNLRVPVSINLAASDFSRPGFADALEEKMLSHTLPPALLSVECLETEKMLESPDALSGLEMLKLRGFKISLDDFGSGYSNINVLRKIPMDTIKLDRSIVGTISTDHASLVIVRNVIRLLKQLDYEVLAEGVENEETVDILRGLGCDEVQGYYYSMPLNPDLFERWCEERAAG